VGRSNIYGRAVKDKRWSGQLSGRCLNSRGGWPYPFHHTGYSKLQSEDIHFQHMVEPLKRRIATTEIILSSETQKRRFPGWREAAQLVALQLVALQLVALSNCPWVACGCASVIRISAEQGRLILTQLDRRDIGHGACSGVYISQTASCSWRLLLIPT